MMKIGMYLAFFFCCVFWMGGAQSVEAAMLLQTRDVISTSQPSAWANHTVEFTVQTTIPSGGSIVITPEDSIFSIPAPFDFSDVDLAIATSTVFTDKDLAGAPGVLTAGVSVTTGMSGSFTITLGSADSINAGERIQIELGSHATYGTAGDQRITNAAVVGSYKIDIETRDAASARLDHSNAMIAMIDAVTVDAAREELGPPVRFNGLPSGLLPGGTANVLMSLETDEPANCRYSESAGVAYLAMTSYFSAASSSMVHIETIAGTTDLTTYTYYVRCQDMALLANADDYIISFDIGVPPSASSTGSVIDGGEGSSESTSQSSGAGGIFPSGGNFLGTAQVTLDGLAFPSSEVTILQDGEVVEQFPVSTDGHFNTLIRNLQRGTYTFGVYATDADDRKSSVYSTTISMSGDTGNMISQIYVPPTVESGNDTLTAGDTLSVFGSGIVDSLLELQVSKQGSILNSNTYIATTTVSGAGKWSHNVDTGDFVDDTYLVKARTSVGGGDFGDWSQIEFIGIGGAPEPDLGIFADLNRDGFVNIVDFSILMFHWGTDGGESDPPADINQEGTVNIADFSIMMFHWTG